MCITCYRKNPSYREKQKIWSLQWRNENRERYRLIDAKYARKKRKESPDYKTEESRKYREKNPKKYFAHKLLNLAVKKGEIEKKPCEKCGKVNVHGHHEDYSTPLVVNWLCSVHHKEVHKVVIS